MTSKHKKELESENVLFNSRGFQHEDFQIDWCTLFLGDLHYIGFATKLHLPRG